jgi:hypothetical protein
MNNIKTLVTLRLHPDMTKAIKMMRFQLRQDLTNEMGTWSFYYVTSERETIRIELNGKFFADVDDFNFGELMHFEMGDC